MQSLSPIIEELLAGLKSKSNKTYGDKIRVTQVGSSAGVLYETVRNFIDYKDEHLLRRSAIERIIKRKLLISPEKNIASGLVRELIWAGYLQNDTVDSDIIQEIENVLEKYKQLLQSPQSPLAQNKYQLWLLGVMSAELDEIISPRTIEEALNRAMYRLISERIKSTSKHSDVQVFLAVRRSLFKEDITTLRYHLLLIYLEDWNRNNQESINKFKQNFLKFHQLFENQLNNSLNIELSRQLRPLTPPFLILKDLIDRNDDPETLFNNPEKLIQEIESTCERKYLQVKNRVNRSIFRSTVYIFLTKMLLTYIFEMPADLYLYGKVKLIPLSINTIFPPTLMYLIGSSISLPGKKNTEKMINMLNQIIYETPEKATLFNIKSEKKSSISSNLFAIIYLISFIISFGIIIFMLDLLKFGIVSGALFLLFLCVVSFFAFRIRNTAKEYMVEGKKEGFTSSIVDIFTLPFLRMGQWISLRFAQFNIFMFILDFIIEAPFKAFIEIAEEWIQFLKHKKEEIV